MDVYVKLCSSPPWPVLVIPVFLLSSNSLLGWYPGSPFPFFFLGNLYHTFPIFKLCEIETHQSNRVINCFIFFGHFFYEYIAHVMFNIANIISNRVGGSGMDIRSKARVYFPILKTYLTSNFYLVLFFFLI